MDTEVVQEPLDQKTHELITKMFNEIKEFTRTHHFVFDNAAHPNIAKDAVIHDAS